MRLVAYIRVSGAGQVSDGYGLAVQEKAVKAWAKAHGHRIVRMVREEGVSGATDALDRPGLSEALLMIREGDAEGLLIPRLDRLARALTVQEATLAIVWRDNGHVFTADTGEVHQDDPDDPMRTAMRQVVGVFAELDRRMVVKRLRDGRAAKQASGRKAVGAYAYGTHGEGEGRDRDSAPNPAEAAARDRILQLRAEGKSYRAIGEILDAEGLPPRRAATWSAMTVRSVCQKAGVA
ncbi:recombinase family protein [Kitasatospora sp. GP82]|uniref:recombinase family protein n=1 Tax=Kitasatospora sp. GP82 TaxID=3035089 RepID=UPI002474BBAA|nr:recombinase family protein [Kitasatospora sp. GP82]MDH6129006.1 DNA invertase Pin-like site-specific DNA recombinase [Kitasatospora sp. GP82]